jgi:NADPH:quinone reductase-like Zn-dependent oxidoreductase
MQKAIVIQGPGQAVVVENHPIPKVTGNFMKVAAVAVALNPSDWKHIDRRADKGATVGFDFSGHVEEVGPDVVGLWEKGARVTGSHMGVSATTMQLSKSSTKEDNNAYEQQTR